MFNKVELAPANHHTKPRHSSPRAMNFALGDARKQRAKRTTNRLAAHREHEALKAARDAAEVESVLNTFQRDFGDGDDDDDNDARERRHVTFVRGGDVGVSSRAVDGSSGTTRARGGSARDAGAERKRKAFGGDADVHATDERTGGDGKKKVRAIDAMLQEFAARAPEARLRTVSGAAAATSGRRSTNVRISNLPSDVGELELAKLFEMYGPIASVKVWRPRDGAHETSTGGYVCFMSRTSAERAMMQLHDTMCFGNVVTVEISKPLRVPQHALWPRVSDASDAAELLACSNADAVHEDEPVAPAATDETSIEPDVVVCVPDDEELRRRIDITAAYVAEDGEPFERELKRRESSNEEFRFLFDAASKEGTYYAWRVFSFAQGDGVSSWRVEPFVMVYDGPRWIPPPSPETRARDAVAVTPQSSTRAVKLSAADRDALVEILRHVTVARDDVRDAMEFAIERAECAADVVDVVTASLLNLDTPKAAKLARLYVVSDLLHNCSAPVRGVQAYRGQFIRTLPQIFEHLERYGAAMKSASSRDAFARDVLAVLAAWDDWCLFADDFARDLKRSFLGGATAA